MDDSARYQHHLQGSVVGLVKDGYVHSLSVMTSITVS
jgi:hypothetical protein